MEIVNNKLYNWASYLDDNARRQAEMTARVPFVERVALMPDAHLGMGSTVGSVIGTNGAIMPAAVGVDIGCGMAAVEFDMDASQLPDSMEGFLPIVEQNIPAGVGQGHAYTSSAADTWYRNNKLKFTSRLDQKLVSTLVSQFGSLGSGNHFFEVCTDERSKVWIVLHSGSRGLGNKLAMRHIADAKKEMELKRVKLESKDLAFFEEGEEGFNLYIGDMLAAQDYAMANRQHMLKRAIEIFKDYVGYKVPMIQTINCHHNFTQKEVHGGKEMWITRKGAIKADNGDLGIIPGSMGTRSYIVEGLGNQDSYCSCSHGAGRVLSRSAAKEKFSVEDLAEQMGDRVWLKDKALSLVDEIPSSYKDIDQVMKDQEDLVKPLHTLSQILSYKGA